MYVPLKRVRFIRDSYSFFIRRDSARFSVFEVQYPVTDIINSFSAFAPLAGLKKRGSHFSITVLFYKLNFFNFLRLDIVC